MISIIAAVAENNVIGVKNDLPWNIPEDLKRFKQLTLGKTVLMGRNTYLSIVSRLGKPLPGRINVVVSSQPMEVPAGVLVYNDLNKALDDLKNEDVFIIGGAMVFQQTLDRVEKLYITHIHKTYEGDTFFPVIDEKIWKKVEEEPHEGFSFVTYQKII